MQRSVEGRIAIRERNPLELVIDKLKYLFFAAAVWD